MKKTLRRLERALPRRKTEAGRQSVIQKIAEIRVLLDTKRPAVPTEPKAPSDESAIYALIIGSKESFDNVTTADPEWAKIRRRTVVHITSLEQLDQYPPEKSLLYKIGRWYDEVPFANDPRLEEYKAGY